MKLSDVKVGASAVVTAVVDGVRSRRLEDLGFWPGTLVRVERRAPLGDPVVYELRGVRLAMRRADAALVEVVETDHVVEAVDGDGSR